MSDPTSSIAESAEQPASRPRRLWWRVLLRLVFIFAVVPYLAVGGLMVAVQRQLLFVPRKTERLLAKDVWTPDRPVEDFEMTADDGLTLHGWHFAGRKLVNLQSRRIVLYFPGNAGCRRNRLADVTDLTELGCDVVIMDYRGYGENPGDPSETKLHADAQALWTAVRERWNYEPREIVLFGESLGGAVAIHLAAEMSRAHMPPAALIVNSTFASMGDTVAWHYPCYPFRYLLFDPFPSIRRIPDVTCAFLQFHGTADETVPFTHGEKLFAAAPPAGHGIAKRFIKVEGAGHNMIAVADMREAVQSLLNALEP